MQGAGRRTLRTFHSLLPVVGTTVYVQTAAGTVGTIAMGYVVASPNAIEHASPTAYGTQQEGGVGSGSVWYRTNDVDIRRGIRRYVCVKKNKSRSPPPSSRFKPRIKLSQNQTFDERSSMHDFIFFSIRSFILLN